MAVALVLAKPVATFTAGFASKMLHTALANPQGKLLGVPPKLVVLTAAAIATPLLIAVCAAVVLVGMIQTRGVIALKRIMPNLQRFSLHSMRQSLVSSARLFAMFRAAVTAVMVGGFAVYRIKQYATDLANCAGQLRAVSVVVGEVTWLIARDVVLVLFTLAAVDLVVSRHAWFKRLKMTRAEVKRDHQEADGNAQLKSARKQAHLDLLNSARVRAVRDATVLVVNPVHLANALRYQYGRDDSPVLIAHGKGELARQMVRAARAYGVPIAQDIPVAQALSELTEGDPIPAGLYEAVAEILRDLIDQQDLTSTTEPTAPSNTASSPATPAPSSP